MGRRRIDAWLPAHLVALRANVLRLKRLAGDRRRNGIEQRLEGALAAYRAELEREVERRRTCSA